MNKEKRTPKTKGDKPQVNKKTLKDLDPKEQDPKGGVEDPDYRKKMIING